MHSFRAAAIWKDARIAESHDPPPGRAPRSDVLRNRERLLETARTLLAEHPQVSMATISAAAGLGRNTIYRHFPNRDALIEAVRSRSSDAGSESATDRLRPAGELANISPTPLSVWDVLNQVPPFQLGVQIVAEAQRLPGVTSAAMYLIDLDGDQLRRMAGPESFPSVLPVDVAVGPEIAWEVNAQLREAVDELLPGAAVAMMHLRGRATGVLIAVGAEHDSLRELAQEAAAALAVGERYTDVPARVRRSRPTSPAAELQQNLLPPRIVRIGGAMLAGNVLPGYDIGGDWFDYTDNPEHAWIGICDVEGQGPRAGATAAILLAAFRSARHREQASAASAVRLMHETLLQLSDEPPKTSVTIATWNGATSLLQWVSCGDYPPVLVGAQGSFKELGERQPTLSASDFPAHLRIQSRRLVQGDRLLLTSDGVTHRLAADGTRFGWAGIRAAVESVPAGSAAITLRAIQDAARAHSSDAFSDDATIVVLAPGAPSP